MCMRSDLEPILAVPNGPFRNSPRVNPGLSFLAPSGRPLGGEALLAREPALNTYLPWVSRENVFSPSQELEVPFFQQMASAKWGAHKALRRCALDEKHSVLRVGNAEGARASWNEFRVLSFVLLPRSISRPFRARRSGRLVPGLKPWAEPSSPFGAELRALRAVRQALNRYQGLPWVSRNKHIRSKGPRKLRSKD
jgi:hypothetical protein